jgi:hypothetical protein
MSRGEENSAEDSGHYSAQSQKKIMSGLTEDNE